VQEAQLQALGDAVSFVTDVAATTALQLRGAILSDDIKATSGRFRSINGCRYGAWTAAAEGGRVLRFFSQVCQLPGIVLVVVEFPALAALVPLGKTPPLGAQTVPEKALSLGAHVVAAATGPAEPAAGAAGAAPSAAGFAALSALGALAFFSAGAAAGAPSAAGLAGFSFLGADFSSAMLVKG
jgi:hypothetical protein